MPKELKLGVQHREIEIRAEDLNEEDRTIELSFSSEEPVERYWGFEVLGHKKGEVDLSRLDAGGPLLLDHKPTVDNQVGITEKVWIEKARGRAVVRFGKSARSQEIFERVKDGDLKSVSVGYRINSMRLEEEEDDKSTYRVTSWTPLEISLVAIAADPTVGPGRSQEGSERPVTIENLKGNDMPKKNDASQASGGNQAAATRAAEPVAPASSQPVSAQVVSQPAVDTDQIVNDAREAEQGRIREITAIGSQFNCREQADKAIKDNLSIEAFRGIVLEHLGSRGEEVMSAANSIGLTSQEARQFSFVRAMRALANPTDRAAQEAAQFEREVSDAAAERLGRSPQGIFVPTDVLRMPVHHGQRDLTVGTATAGGHTVSTDLLASSFIDLLRKRMALARLGARTLNDLSGNLAIPRQTGGATAYWVAESGAPTESQQAFDQVALTPKTIGAYTDYSRKLLLQSSIDVEAFVRDDLTKVIALEVDRAGLYGSGSSNQPQGIANLTGINSVTFAAADPTYVEVVNLESQVAADDADVGTLAYAMDAAMRGAFKTTEKASGTAQFIWEQGNTVNGYRSEVSNQVVDGDVWFGNWDDLLIAMWSGIDLMIDPYTNSTSGTVRVVALQDMDIAGRHPESFCLGNDGV